MIDCLPGGRSCLAVTIQMLPSARQMQLEQCMDSATWWMISLLWLRKCHLWDDLICPETESHNYESIISFLWWQKWASIGVDCIVYEIIQIHHHHCVCCSFSFNRFLFVLFLSQLVHILSIHFTRLLAYGFKVQFLMYTPYAKPVKVAVMFSTNVS